MHTLAAADWKSTQPKLYVSLSVAKLFQVQQQEMGVRQAEGLASNSSSNFNVATLHAHCAQT